MDERLIDVGTLKLNVAEGALSGPPLLLLHAGSGSWQGWAPVAERLSRRWHVIAPDFRGHGGSDGGNGYRVTDYAEDIEALIERHIGDGAVLAGHSLGGHVAVAVAARRPDLVRGVVIGDAPFDLAFTRAHIAANRARNVAWRDLAASRSPTALIAARLADVETPLPDGRLGRIADVVPVGAPWYHEMAQNLARLDPAVLDAVIEFEEMHAGLEWWPRNARAPMLFVQGNPELGGLLLDSDVDRWFDEQRGDRRVKLRDTGHELFLRRPDSFTLAVTPFLDDLHRNGFASSVR